MLLDGARRCGGNSDASFVLPYAGPLPTSVADIPLLRIPLQPNITNGLTAPCNIMIDKITTAHRSKLGQRIGKVSTTEMLQLERGLLVYLGMTG